MRPQQAYYSDNKYNNLRKFKTNIKLNPNWKNLDIIEKIFPQCYFINSEEEDFYIVKGAYDYLIETGEFLYGQDKRNIQ